MGKNSRLRHLLIASALIPWLVFSINSFGQDATQFAYTEGEGILSVSKKTDQSFHFSIATHNKSANICDLEGTASRSNAADQQDTFLYLDRGCGISFNLRTRKEIEVTATNECQTFCGNGVTFSGIYKTENDCEAKKISTARTEFAKVLAQGKRSKISSVYSQLRELSRKCSEEIPIEERAWLVSDLSLGSSKLGYTGLCIAEAGSMIEAISRLSSEPSKNLNKAFKALKFNKVKCQKDVQKRLLSHTAAPIAVCPDMQAEKQTPGPQYDIKGESCIVTFEPEAGALALDGTTVSTVWPEPMRAFQSCAFESVKDFADDLCADTLLTNKARVGPLPKELSDKLTSGGLALIASPGDVWRATSDFGKNPPPFYAENKRHQGFFESTLMLTEKGTSNRLFYESHLCKCAGDWPEDKVVDCRREVDPDYTCGSWSFYDGKLWTIRKEYSPM